MRKLIFILFCLISLTTKAQVYQEMPQYGYRANRMAFDSTLQIPTTCGVPTLKSNVTKKAAIAFDSCNNKIYRYNPKTLTWSEISGGSSIDTTSLSNRINLKLNISDTATMLQNYLDYIPNLQQVTNVNDSTTNSIYLTYDTIGWSNSIVLYPASDSGIKPKIELASLNGFTRITPDYSYINDASNNQLQLSSAGLNFNNSTNYSVINPIQNGYHFYRLYQSDTSKHNDTLATLNDIRIGSIPIDTSSLSNRINTKIDSLKRQTDSVFARKNGSWIFQYNGFVPYTGATGDVDLGNNQLNAKAIKINGTAGNGHIDLKHQSADATATGSSTALFANSNGDLKWKNDNKYYTTLTTNQTADRVYTFQNKSYTLADSADVAGKQNAITGLLTSHALETNSSGNIVTSSITSTELGYLNGVSSSIQNQFSGKLNTSDSTIYYSKYRSDTSRSNIYSAINGKQATVTFSTTGTTGAATFSSNTLNIPNYSNNDALVAKAYGLLGSTIKGINLCLPNYAMMTGTTAALASGTVRFIAYYLPNDQTITGVKWWSSANASYTANNYNGVGLYSYSGGTLTLVASSTNDGNIWSGAASNSMGSKAFSQQIALSAGIYYIGLLYSSSAQTTAPSLGSAGVMTQTNMGSADFTNSARLLGSLISQTALPNSQALSGTSSGTATLGVWLY